MLLPIAVALIAIVQVICVLALVDQYRSLLQIRENLGLVDTPQPVHLPAMAAALSPSAVGLPARLDAEDRVVVAFLSTRCMTCRTIGRSLRGRVPPGTWVVVCGSTAEDRDRWLAEVELSGERLTLEDMYDGIASRLDLHVFPSALVFEHGALVQALTLPSSRQLDRLLSAPAVMETARSVLNEEPEHAH
jgi:hypothetical protein